MIWKILRISILQKMLMLSLENSKTVAEQPLHEEIRCVTKGSHEQVQQKPGIETGISRKNLWKIILSNDVDPLYIHGRQTRFLRNSYQQKH